MTTQITRVCRLVADCTPVTPPRLCDALSPSTASPGRRDEGGRRKGRVHRPAHRLAAARSRHRLLRPRCGGFRTARPVHCLRVRSGCPTHRHPACTPASPSSFICLSRPRDAFALYGHSSVTPKRHTRIKISIQEMISSLPPQGPPRWVAPPRRLVLRRRLPGASVPPELQGHGRAAVLRVVWAYGDQRVLPRWSQHTGAWA